MMDWQTFASFVLHPLIFLILENLVIILILGFTSADSIVRPAVLPLLLACVWKVTLICPEKIHRVAWAGLLCGHIILCPILYVESALISKWTFEAQGPTSSAGSEPLHATYANRKNHGGSFWERCRFGFFVITSTRNTGMSTFVKNTPPFSSDNPNYIPSRAAFLYRKVIIIIICFLILDLASQGTQPLEHNAVFFSAETVPIFTGNGDNLKFEKIISRLLTVLAYWVCAYAVIITYNSITSFVLVALGIKNVWLYRPVFGPIGEAYSVRQFWG